MIVVELAPRACGDCSCDPGGCGQWKTLVGTNGLAGGSHVVEHARTPLPVCCGGPKYTDDVSVRTLSPIMSI